MQKTRQPNCDCLADNHPMYILGRRTSQPDSVLPLPFRSNVAIEKKQSPMRQVSCHEHLPQMAQCPIFVNRQENRFASYLPVKDSCMLLPFSVSHIANLNLLDLSFRK
jgi:hypothetical protein